MESIRIHTQDTIKVVMTKRVMIGMVTIKKDLIKMDSIKVDMTEKEFIKILRQNLIMKVMI